jgi:hypothetical protein
MGKSFTTMESNVGTMVQDTSTAFATIIGTFLNNRYQDIWDRALWSDCIDDSYTFNTVANTQNYDLPLDFDEELFVANITDGYILDRYQEGHWWKERYSAHSAGTIDAGNPRIYVVLYGAINAAGTGFGKIKIDPTPDAVKTMALPYKRKFVSLISVSGTCTTDTALKVIAAAETFITDGVKPGMRIKNTTDSTYSIIASVDSETQLTCDTDVCPDGNETFEIYTEPVIRDIDIILETGATADALAYKKQLQKADYYNQRYETELARRIAKERSRINQKYQFISESYKINGPVRLTGDSSYDTI